MIPKIPLPALGRFALTMLVLAIAVTAGWTLWQRYEVRPWTRDGRVKAYVVQVAPDVTGQVTQVLVRDNQPVRAGQVLFQVDKARYELALRQAQATVQSQRAALAQATREVRRNGELGELVAQETREQALARTEQLRAALAQATAALDLAKLNLARSTVVSPVNGYVTNLDLRGGGYVMAGHPVMALVDRDSFYVEGYFEENKLPRIHVGDPVTVSLMGASEPLEGHVESFAEGIADRDRSTAANLLPNVNPTFNWVRLAQRIPVRVAIDRVPASTRLVAGQTATVEVHEHAATTHSAG